MKATTDYLTAGSRYFRSGLHRFFRIQNKTRPSSDAAEHALALQAAQLGCFQIRHDDAVCQRDPRSVMVPDAGADCLCSEPRSTCRTINRSALG